MEEFEGTILAGRSLTPTRGRVVVEDGEIAAVEQAKTASTNIILPAFVNAHTHIGDAVAKEAAVGLSLGEAVVPPDSLKHRRLAAASHEQLVTAMGRTMQFMAQTGTVRFFDFRESGPDGTRQLRAAAAGQSVEPFIFGSGEPGVLEIADGYGASGATDGDFTDHRAAANESGVPFAIHAGEPNATDIHPALDLDPDLLVHMVHATDDHLERVAQQDVPVAVCPRANLTLRVGHASISDLLDHTTVALGTDNVMLNSPSMFREMAHTAKNYDVTAREVLKMATVGGAEAMGLDCGVIEAGRRAGLVVLDGDSHNLAGTEDPARAIVRRAGPLDIRDVILPAFGE